MAVGDSHTCALSASGAVACWGGNNYELRAVPGAVAAGGQVAVAAGGYHTCALSSVGAMACWGSNTNGQTDVPRAIAAGGQAALTAGWGHTCALSVVGAVTCWGDNGTGQTAVPLAFVFGSVALPCRPATLPIASPSPSAASTPGFACAASLFRTLPYMDLTGTRLGGSALATPGTPAWHRSEEACRIACCTVAGCSGYAYALHDPASRYLSTPVPCFLFANITQLIPSSGYTSGVRESALL